MRLQLAYFDHNETFAELLPVAGAVARRLNSNDGGEWFLFELDAIVLYEDIPYSHFLLRSRWPNMKVGGEEPTSVFILLVSDQQQAKDGFEVHHFPLVAWGMAQIM